MYNIYVYVFACMYHISGTLCKLRCLMLAYQNSVRAFERIVGIADVICDGTLLIIINNTANLKIIDARYQLSTVFSTRLLPENR